MSSKPMAIFSVVFFFGIADCCTMAQNLPDAPAPCGPNESCPGMNQEGNKGILPAGQMKASGVSQPQRMSAQAAAPQASQQQGEAALNKCPSLDSITAECPDENITNPIIKLDRWIKKHLW